MRQRVWVPWYDCARRKGHINEQVKKDQELREFSFDSNSSRRGRFIERLPKANYF